MSNETSERATDRLESLRDRLFDGMGRREFLRTVGATGYALGMAHLLGVEDFLTASSGTVPIVTALARSEPSGPLEERTTTVPISWYRAVRRSFELHSQFASSAVPGYLGSSVLPAAHDEARAPIVVNLSRDQEGFDRATRALERFFSEVPVTIDAIDGIPESVEAETVTGAPNRAGSLDSGLVPGGVRCQNTVGEGTLGPALYEGERGQPFYTASEHLYHGIEEPVGEVLLLPREGASTTALGPVTATYPQADFLVVEPPSTSDLRPQSSIKRPDGERIRVSGQYTRMGLADLAARNEPLQKVAAQTGHSSGQIKGIDAVTCYTGECHREQLAWGDEENFTDGDSGSVSFHPDLEAPEEAVLVASLNNARTWWPGQNFIWGAAAYHVLDYGYHF